MKRKLLAICLLVALLLSMVVPCAYAAPSDTVYVRKHVSLVYDNSGSMSMLLEDNVPNLKWTYASYAAQIFAGLLNDTDSLTITLMNQNRGTQKVEVDLKADRQQQVDQIRDVTNYAKDGTPFTSVTDAESVLVDKGLLSDEQIGENLIDKSQQYWLVLTTDGRFEHTSTEAVETGLEDLLKKYSNLQLVYFGIGTRNDNSDQKAIDFGKSDKLTAYPNFTAVYAEDETEIVSTMRTLANRISGRYSVSDGVKIDGSEVTLRISGETSPIRNIAILLQNTEETLLSAVDEDGKALNITRAANEQFPRNPGYNNVPEGTKGGHTALITCPDGKFPPGTVKLTFSGPVNEKDLSLMYEPAVYVTLQVQQKDDAGEWVEVPYGQKVQGGTPLRVSYVICEDGTDTPIDPEKLPGVTTEHITCGNTELARDSEFAAPQETSNITATVSLMDGAYTVSTVRTLQVVALDAYTFEATDDLVFYTEELAANTAQYIDFKVLYQGAPATADRLTDFSVDAGDLQGKLTTPEPGVFRFTPKQADCAPGGMQIHLRFLGRSVLSRNVTVKDAPITYAAQAGDGLTLFDTEMASNTTPVSFSVTRTRDKQTIALPEEEAGDFRIDAVSADGTVLNGVTTYENGQLHFVTNDTKAPVGEYTLTLYRHDEALASARIVILKYNVQFTAEVFRVGGGEIDLFDLRNSESALAFVVYADGEPCPATQLEGMLGTMLLLEHDCPDSILRLDLSVGEHNGKAALLAKPTTTARNGVAAFFQKMQIAGAILFKKLWNGPITVDLTVQAEKGTQVSGTLDMHYDAIDYLIWLIILICMLALLILAGLVVIANVMTPKILPGTLTKYSIMVLSGGKAQVTDSSQRLGKRFLFQLDWKPRPIKCQDMIFTAADREYMRKGDPICLIKNDEQLGSYTYEDTLLTVEELLRTLDEYSGTEFIFSEVRESLQGLAVAYADELPDNAEYARFPMPEGTCLMCSDGPLIQVWVYHHGANRKFWEREEANEEEI